MTKKYMVALSYFRNFQDMELAYGYGDSIEECSKAVREFIDKYDVTSSEWQGGQLYSETSYIGVIAYNGKYFDKIKAKKYGLK